MLTKRGNSDNISITNKKSTPKGSSCKLQINIRLKKAGLHTDYGSKTFSS